MARREMDQTAIDRAARRAEGKEPEVEAVDPGEAELTSQAATPESEPQAEASRTEVAVAEDVAKREEPADPVHKKLHNKREEIVARAKAKRAEERGDAEAEPATPQEEPEPRAVPGDQPISPTRRLKVDRVEREVTPEEYDTAARTGLALGNRLAELNALLPQLRALANGQQTRQAEGDADSRASLPENRQQTSQTPSRAVAVPDEVADRIRDRLVYGENEDGREAIRELAASLGPSFTMDDAVAALRAQLAREEELQRVGNDFVGRHGVVAADPDLRLLTAREVHALAIADMRRIGVEEHFLEQAAQDPDIAYDWHKDFRKRGFVMTDPNDLADQAAAAVRQRFSAQVAFLEQQYGQPQPGAQRPAPTNLPQRTMQPEMRDQRAQRVAEKEQMRQPRRAAMVARTPSAPPAKSTSEVIAGMRQKRGYSNYR